MFGQHILPPFSNFRRRNAENEVRLAVPSARLKRLTIGQASAIRLEVVVVFFIFVRWSKTRVQSGQGRTC